MQKFKSHKIVEAVKIADIRPNPENGGAFLVPMSTGERMMDSIPVSRAYLLKHEPKPFGYYVKYPDGYESFSPAEAFEGGYTAVDAYPTPVETLTTGQPKITGYRNLSQDEIDLMNEGKALAEQCGAFITKLRSHANSGGTPVERDYLQLDQRWISIGATDLQRGFMAVIRGIAQPTTF